MKTVAPYGTWKSTLTGEYIAQASVKPSEPLLHQGNAYWLEGRPAENGRQTIVRQNGDGSVDELLAAPWNARSKVHEYGGGSYTVSDHHLYFCHYDDQQIYRLNLTTQTIEQVTNTPSCRYADLHFDPVHQRLLAICEDHQPETLEPKNRLVAFVLGRSANATAAPLIVDDHHDFVSSPRVSPDGRWLTYISWDHPDMPWDATELWLCEIDARGTIDRPRRIAGGALSESIVQPQWSPLGDLFWISDRSNWWNLYSLTRLELDQIWRENIEEPVAAPIYREDADCTGAQWQFNLSTYGFLNPHTLLMAVTRAGIWELVQLHWKDHRWQPIPMKSELVYIAHIHYASGQGLVLGATPQTPLAVYRLSNDGLQPITTTHQPLGTDDVSVGRSLTFSSGQNEQAYGFFYAPTHSEFQAEQGSLPPVIVIGHGGPTGASDPSFNYKIQFWTQRGFAVLDVNYRGSTGFGRRYRQALNTLWGVADVEDLCTAAEFVTTQGWVHPSQRIIRGSSAGGYSVLAALTDRDTFNAGVSLYGIGDLETLVTDTHKFEARYLDRLIGPYPEQQALYRERSPIHKVAQINCPVLVFQGQDDKVVPPAQAEMMVNSLRAQGIPVAYVLYPNEGHGFRRSTTIAHQLAAELYFYQKLLNLDANMDTAAPMVIHNWEQS